MKQLLPQKSTATQETARKMDPVAKGDSANVLKANEEKDLLLHDDFEDFLKNHGVKIGDIQAQASLEDIKKNPPDTAQDDEEIECIQPWNNEELIKEILRKRELFKRAKRTQYPDVWDEFREQRIKVTHMISAAKLAYSGKKLPKVEEKVFCDPCERGFAGIAKLISHRRVHEKCPYEGCRFEGLGYVIDGHQQAQHFSERLSKVWHITSREEIEKWREERKKNYPPSERIAARQAEQELKTDFNFSCDACDRCFTEKRDLDIHCNLHQKCDLDDCKYEGLASEMHQHLEMHHKTDLASTIWNIVSLEEINLWIKDRKQYYPGPKQIKNPASEVQKDANSSRIDAKNQLEKNNRLSPSISRETEKKSRKEGDATKQATTKTSRNSDKRQKQSPERNSRDKKDKITPDRSGKKGTVPKRRSSSRSPLRHNRNRRSRSNSLLRNNGNRSPVRRRSRNRSPLPRDHNNTSRSLRRSRSTSPSNRTRKRRSPLPRSRSPVRRNRSPLRHSRSPARRIRSPVRVRSPLRRSRSPTRRVRSPLRRSRSRSPTSRRVRSPLRRSRSRSPTSRRVRSPLRRSRSRSPTSRRVRSPLRRSRSPVRRVRSPLRRSRSPTYRCVRSPLRRSRSPTHRIRSPLRKSRSRSPVRRTRSPLRHSPELRNRSPLRRSQSPLYHRRITLEPDHRGSMIGNESPKRKEDRYRMDKAVPLAREYSSGSVAEERALSSVSKLDLLRQLVKQSGVSNDDGHLQTLKEEMFIKLVREEFGESVAVKLLKTSESTVSSSASRSSSNRETVSSSTVSSSVSRSSSNRETLNRGDAGVTTLQHREKAAPRCDSVSTTGGGVKQGNLLDSLDNDVKVEIAQQVAAILAATGQSAVSDEVLAQIVQQAVALKTKVPASSRNLQSAAVPPVTSNYAETTHFNSGQRKNFELGSTQSSTSLTTEPADGFEDWLNSELHGSR